MIISTSREVYDNYWDDFETVSSHYWVIDPKVARRVTRLQAKAAASSYRAMVIYNISRVLKYIVAPLAVFITTLLLTGINTESDVQGLNWIAGGVLGLVFGVSLLFAFMIVDTINFLDGYGGPSSGSFRRERLLRKATRISHKAKVSDRIPVSWALGHLYDNPEMRSIMLEHSGEITRRLIESEAVEMRKLLALPKEELSPEKRSELRYKIDVIEDDIVSMVKEEAAVRKSTEAEEAEMRNIEAAEAAKARRAGNDLHANLLLRKIK